MRICLVIEAGGGGASCHVLDIAGELQRRGHHAHPLYCTVRADARYLAEIAALPIVAQPIEMHREIGLHDLRSARTPGAAVRSAGLFNIVHGHSSKAGAIVRLADVGGATRVYTPHAFRGLDPNSGFVANILFNGADFHPGCATHRCADRGIAQGTGLCGAPSHRGRQASPYPQWRDPHSRNHSRRGPDCVGLNADDIVFGFVGRLSYQKAPGRFVEVASRVMRRVPAARAVTLGDGKNAEAIERDIAQSRLADRFIWKHRQRRRNRCRRSMR